MLSERAEAVLAKLAPRMRDARKACAFRCIGPHCLPEHIRRGESELEKAFAVILYTVVNRPDKLNSAGSAVATEFLDLVGSDEGSKIRCGIAGLTRDSVCASVCISGLTLESGLLASKPALPLVVRGADPADWPTVPVVDLCDMFERSPDVFSAVYGAAAAYRDHSSANSWVGYTAPSLTDLPSEYRCVDVVVGYRTFATDDAAPIAARLCRSGSKMWMEFDTDGISGAVYRFSIQTSKYGFLPEDETSYGDSLIWFLEAWVGGQRNKFGVKSSKGRHMVMHSSLSKEAVRIGKCKNRQPPLKIFLPQCSASFDMALEHFLTDALKTAKRALHALSGRTALKETRARAASERLPNREKRASPEPGEKRASPDPGEKRASPDPGEKRASPEPGEKGASPDPGEKRASPDPGEKRASPDPGEKRASPDPGEKGASPEPGEKRASPDPGEKRASRKKLKTPSIPAKRRKIDAKPDPPPSAVEPQTEQGAKKNRRGVRCAPKKLKASVLLHRKHSNYKIDADYEDNDDDDVTDDAS